MKRIAPSKFRTAALLLCTAPAWFRGAFPAVQNSEGTPGSAAEKAPRIALSADSPLRQQLKVEPVPAGRVPVHEVVAPGRVGFDIGRVSRVLLPTTGRISKVLVRLGDAVSSGQPLLEIESPDAEGAIAECRQADAAVLQAQSALHKAQADYERTRDLLEHKAVARKDLLASENELNQARASLEQASAGLIHCRRQLEILGLRPGVPDQRVVVRAALRGKVIDMAVTEGEYRSDTSTPLMTLADLSVVWVTSEVPENAIRFVEPGERVQVELVAFPGEVFDARVTRIADTVDPKTRTIQVQAEMPNPQRKFRPEMFGRIRHHHAEQSLPVIPAQAMIQTPDGTYVFVERSPGVFERVRIQTEPPRAEGIPVRRNLSPGDRIVTGGAMLLLGMERH